MNNINFKQLFGNIDVNLSKEDAASIFSMLEKYNNDGDNDYSFLKNKNDYEESNIWSRIPLGVTPKGQLCWDPTQHGSFAIINDGVSNINIANIIYKHTSNFTEKYDFYYSDYLLRDFTESFISLMGGYQVANILPKKNTIIYLSDLSEVIKELNNLDREHFIKNLKWMIEFTNNKNCKNNIYLILDVTVNEYEEYFKDFDLKTINHMGGDYALQSLSKKSTPFSFYKIEEKILNEDPRCLSYLFNVERLKN